MRVDIIDNSKALAALRANWEAVYDADPEAQFFLSWIWMFRWLTAIDRSWFVMAARPDAEAAAYVAFLPLWMETREHKAGGFYNVIQMGGNSAADYTGFICRTEHQEEAIPAFAAEVKRLNWTQLRFDCLRASDERTALFMQAFCEQSFTITETSRLGADHVDNSICPIAPLPADWDAYLDNQLSANTRQKLRRLLRQVERSAELRITHADAATIERDIETLLRFWTERWGPQKGAQLAGILKNNRLMLRHAFQAGALFLPVLWQGDRPVGALAILADARKKSFLFFIAGRDETFEGPPAGLVLHAHSIRHAIRNGFVCYDFLRGNEPYKYSFGVEERRATCFVLTTRDGKNLGGLLDPRGVPFALKRSLEHHRAGRSHEAELGFRQVLDCMPDNADALYGLGQIMAKKGEHAAAIGLLRSLLAARPDVTRAWFWLGRSLRVTGAFSEAARAFCTGLEREPSLAGAYYDLGHLLLPLGLIDRAIGAFVAARDLQPDFPDLEASLARALRLRGGLSAEELECRAAPDAELGERVGRLPAVAAAADRQRAASAPTPISVPGERPLPASSLRHSP